MVSDWARKPHASRVRLAHAVAAHADPALDAFLPPLGPCGVCGVPGLDQRHRVVDAIAEALAAGEKALGDKDTDRAKSEFQKAFDHARDSAQVTQAANSLYWANYSANTISFAAESR